MDIIEELIKREWEMFGKVNNEGGRAECQEDYETFWIMRSSQFLAWTEEVRQSYLADLTAAKEQGYNLVMEKYARMMESTAKAEYDKLKKHLPEVPEQKIQVAEAITKIQVAWREDFAKQYPLLSAQSRRIHSEEDEPYETSFETYLRGELFTYSPATLHLYGRMIAEYMQQKKNITEMIMAHTSAAYGYQSLDAAETKLKNN